MIYNTPKSLDSPIRDDDDANVLLKRQKKLDYEDYYPVLNGDDTTWAARIADAKETAALADQLEAELAAQPKNGLLTRNAKIARAEADRLAAKLLDYRR